MRLTSQRPVKILIIRIIPPENGNGLLRRKYEMMRIMMSKNSRISFMISVVSVLKSLQVGKNILHLQTEAIMFVDSNNLIITNEQGELFRVRID
jgi:hypothetical protein